VVQVESLDHLVLTVRDLDAALAFYSSLLRMQIVTFGENRKALAFGTQTINLHVAGREFEPKATAPTPGSADLCFLTGEPLESVVEHLRSAGVQVIEGPVWRSGAKGPIRSVYIRDPDGNLIEIANRVIQQGEIVRMDIELTPSQERALCVLVGMLDSAGVCYQFTGGFAGNLHGSRWPLHDLDVDVTREGLPRLSEVLRPYTTQPLGLYVDHEFELQLLRAELEGVVIDVSQAEEAYARVGGRRVPLNTSLAHRRRVRVLDLEAWVQPLEELIAYKQLLGRQADLADLRTLQARSTSRASASQ
jgi:catechol 2,3-dioxygenase-like lactoylglutathione lyase family enzyme